ncbi:MAG TPA: plastocyanin/azurin family copper-binding protein [Solirubrobacteraceae bacterium]|nr:plastocyanin/azurin family copper-binding protein [Solirubrobacteraceae bacterium]
MRSLRFAAPAALAFALLGVVPAQADQQITAAPVDRYVNTSVTIAPGERLTFTSQDPIMPHNVTARDNGADGRPLFSSATIGGGDTAPVVGTDKLEPGAYAFFCTVHPTLMNGTLTVAGDPVNADTTPPDVSARVDSTGLRALDQRKAILLTLSASEAVTVDVTVRAFDTTLAKRTVSLAAGATAVALKMTAKGLRGIRKRSRVNLKIVMSAEDGAGNTATSIGKQTLKRGK